MEELTPKTVFEWLRIEEGSAYDYLRDLKKQPLRRAVIWQRLARERSKLTRLRNELTTKKNELNTLIAKKVVEFKKLENPKSQAAIDNFKKNDLELDPQVKALRREVIELERKIAEQEDEVNSWQAFISMVKEKTGILETCIRMETALSGDNLIDKVE